MISSTFTSQSNQSEFRNSVSYTASTSDDCRTDGVVVVPPSDASFPLQSAPVVVVSASSSTITTQSGFDEQVTSTSTSDAHDSKAVPVDPVDVILPAASTPSVAPIILKIVIPEIVDAEAMLEMFQEYKPLRVHCSHKHKNQDTTTGYIEFEHVDKSALQEMQHFTYNGDTMTVSIFPSLPSGYRKVRCFQRSRLRCGLICHLLRNNAGALQLATC